MRSSPIATNAAPAGLSLMAIASRSSSEGEEGDVNDQSSDKDRSTSPLVSSTMSVTSTTSSSSTTSSKQKVNLLKNLELVMGAGGPAGAAASNKRRRDSIQKLMDDMSSCSSSSSSSSSSCSSSSTSSSSTSSSSSSASSSSSSSSSSASSVGSEESENHDEEDRTSCSAEEEEGEDMQGQHEEEKEEEEGTYDGSGGRRNPLPAHFLLGEEEEEEEDDDDNDGVLADSGVPPLAPPQLTRTTSAEVGAGDATSDPVSTAGMTVYLHHHHRQRRPSQGSLSLDEDDHSTNSRLTLFSDLSASSAEEESESIADWETADRIRRLRESLEDSKRRKAEIEQSFCDDPFPVRHQHPVVDEEDPANDNDQDSNKTSRTLQSTSPTTVIFDPAAEEEPTTTEDQDNDDDHNGMEDQDQDDVFSLKDLMEQISPPRQPKQPSSITTTNLLLESHEVDPEEAEVATTVTPTASSKESAKAPSNDSRRVSSPPVLQAQSEVEGQNKEQPVSSLKLSLLKTTSSGGEESAPHNKDTSATLDSSSKSTPTNTTTPTTKAKKSPNSKSPRRKSGPAALVVVAGEAKPMSSLKLALKKTTSSDNLPPLKDTTTSPTTNNNKPKTSHNSKSPRRVSSPPSLVKAATEASTHTKEEQTLDLPMNTTTEEPAFEEDNSTIATTATPKPNRRVGKRGGNTTNRQSSSQRPKRSSRCSASNQKQTNQEQDNNNDDGGDDQEEPYLPSNPKRTVGQGPGEATAAAVATAATKPRSSSSTQKSQRRNIRAKSLPEAHIGRYSPVASAAPPRRALTLPPLMPMSQLEQEVLEGEDNDRQETTDTEAELDDSCVQHTHRSRKSGRHGSLVSPKTLGQQDTDTELETEPEDEEGPTSSVGVKDSNRRGRTIKPARLGRGTYIRSTSKDRGSRERRSKKYSPSPSPSLSSRMTQEEDDNYDSEMESEEVPSSASKPLPRRGRNSVATRKGRGSCARSTSKDRGSKDRLSSSSNRNRSSPSPAPSLSSGLTQGKQQDDDKIETEREQEDAPKKRSSSRGRTIKPASFFSTSKDVAGKGGHVRSTSRDRSIKERLSRGRCSPSPSPSVAKSTTGGPSPRSPRKTLRSNNSSHGGRSASLRSIRTCNASVSDVGGASGNYTEEEVSSTCARRRSPSGSKGRQLKRSQASQRSLNRHRSISIKANEQNQFTSSRRPSHRPSLMTDESKGYMADESSSTRHDDDDNIVIESKQRQRSSRRRSSLRTADYDKSSRLQAVTLQNTIANEKAGRRRSRNSRRRHSSCTEGIKDDSQHSKRNHGKIRKHRSSEDALPRRNKRHGSKTRRRSSSRVRERLNISVERSSCRRPSQASVVEPLQLILDPDGKGLKCEAFSFPPVEVTTEDPVKSAVDNIKLDSLSLSLHSHFSSKEGGSSHAGRTKGYGLPESLRSMIGHGSGSRAPTPTMERRPSLMSLFKDGASVTTSPVPSSNGSVASHRSSFRERLISKATGKKIPPPPLLANNLLSKQQQHQVEQKLHESCLF